MSDNVGIAAASRSGSFGSTSTGLLAGVKSRQPEAWSRLVELYSPLVWQRVVELVRAEFEPATWHAFWRVAVDAVRPADAAEELGMSIPAVCKAKSRVLCRLRQALVAMEQGQ